MAIAHNSSLGNSNGNSTSAVLGSINVAGSDGYIEVALLLENTGITVSSFNFDDGAGGDQQALTQIGSYQDIESGNFRIYLYRLVGPHTGSGRRLIATLSGSVPYQMGADFYTGVDQTTPTTDPQQGTDASSPASQLNTSNLNGSWQIGVANCPYGSLVITSGGVNRQQVSVASGVGYIEDSNAEINSGSTNTLNWTFSTKMGWITHMLRPSVSAAELAVDTGAATDITHNSATLNGEITDIGESTPDERGFVWGTSSQSDPGDVAPASTSYDDYDIDTGSFSAEPFDLPITGLTNSTTYYVRAYAHNDEGYVYGDEISFDTDEAPPFRFTNLAGIEFDEEDTQTIYAERLNDILDRLDALEG